MYVFKKPTNGRPWTSIFLCQVLLMCMMFASHFSPQKLSSKTHFVGLRQSAVIFSAQLLEAPVLRMFIESCLSDKINGRPFFTFRFFFLIYLCQKPASLRGYWLDKYNSMASTRVNNVKYIQVVLHYNSKLRSIFALF